MFLEEVFWRNCVFLFEVDGVVGILTITGATVARSIAFEDDCTF